MFVKKVIQWDEPEEQNGVVTGYKVSFQSSSSSSSSSFMMMQVYYTTTPNKPLSQWDSQFVDNNKLTTISDLTPHTIYTIRSVISIITTHIFLPLCLTVIFIYL